MTLQLRMIALLSLSLGVLAGTSLSSRASSETPPCALSENRSGGNSTSGADEIGVTVRPAWFLGKERVVRTCLRGYFGSVSREQLQSTVEKSFRKWNQYISREVTSLRSDDLLPASRVLIEECNDATELVIFLGETDTSIDSAIRLYKNPTALALPAAANRPGSLWIKNSMNILFGANLEALLTHEIGHLLGFNHIDGTIMSESVLTFLHLGTRERQNALHEEGYINDSSSQWDHREQALSSIEIDTELTHPFDRDVSLVRPIADARLGAFTTYRTASESFQIFTSRAPRGVPVIAFQGRTKNTAIDVYANDQNGHSSNRLPEFELTFSDGSDSLKFPIDLDLESLDEVLKKCQISNLPSAGALALKSCTSDWSGTVKTASGREISVLVQIRGGRFVDVYYQDIVPGILKALRKATDVIDSSQSAGFHQLGGKRVRIPLIITRDTFIRGED